MILRADVVYLTKVRIFYGTGDRSVSYPFFSGYERNEAFPQDTDLSPVPLFRGTAKYFLAYFKEIVLEDKALNLVFLYRNIVINTGVNKIRLSLRISFVYSK